MMKSFFDLMLGIFIFFNLLGNRNVFDIRPEKGNDSVKYTSVDSVQIADKKDFDAF